MTDDMKDWPRLNGVEAWALLTPADQASIGALAIELCVAWEGADRYCDDPRDAVARAFMTADTVIGEALAVAVDSAVMESHRRLSVLPLDPDDTAPTPLPASIGPVCRCCGCSQEDGCSQDHSIRTDAGDGAPLLLAFPACHWVEPDLCSACHTLQRTTFRLTRADGTPC